MHYFKYNAWPRFKLYHHAIQYGDDKYYHIFIVDKNRKTLTTEGERNKAMRAAFVEAIKWLDTFVDTDATFEVISNAVEIATVRVGDIELIDTKRVQEMDAVYELEWEEEDAKEMEG